MAITTLSIDEATRDFNTHDARATAITAATVSATINGTINGVPLFSMTQIAVPSIATCTWSVQQYVSVSSTWVTIPEDLYGTSYPRSLFTGRKLLTFVHQYGGPLRIVSATAPSSAYVVGIQARD